MTPDLSAALADLGADLSLILLHDDPDGGDQ